jgi:hypothetical protein
MTVSIQILIYSLEIRCYTTTEVETALLSNLGSMLQYYILIICHCSMEPEIGMKLISGILFPS